MSRRKTENENDRHRHLRRADRADHHNMQHDAAWDHAQAARKALELMNAANQEGELSPRFVTPQAQLILRETTAPKPTLS